MWKLYMQVRYDSTKSPPITSDRLGTNSAYVCSIFYAESTVQLLRFPSKRTIKSRLDYEGSALAVYPETATLLLFSRWLCSHKLHLRSLKSYLYPVCDIKIRNSICMAVYWAYSWFQFVSINYSYIREHTHTKSQAHGQNMAQRTIHTQYRAR